MDTLHLLRDISIVLIAIELFVILLVPAVILFFVDKGLALLRRFLRQHAPTVQFRFRQAAEIAERTSQKAAAPVIAVDAFAARVRRMWQVL